MRRVIVLSALFCAMAGAQQTGQNQPPPRSEGSVSSSKDTKVDLSAPLGQAPVVLDAPADPDVVEMTPYDPHRAEKALEVGEYYLKRKNYKAAESRFQEALEFKPNDPAATMLLGSVYERSRRPVEAFKLYAEYLAATPGGERAGQANEGLARLQEAVRSAGENPDRLRADALAKVAEQFYRARNWPIARERFEEVLRIDPQHSLGLLRLAQTLEQVGEFDSAVRTYDRFLASAQGAEAQTARAARDRLVKVGAGRN